MTAFATGTHPGLKREHNEDRYQADSNLGLWLVADGVGGHASGEVAAAIARDVVTADIAAGVALVDAIPRAHKAVLAEIRSRGSSNMGSTIVALTLNDNRYEIAWVGDSRAYLFDGELKQLTRDHNPVSELLAQGLITAKEAASHPDRHVLTQSLGVAESVVVSPGLVTGQLQPGQQILLCSDGLTDELDDASIAREMSRQPTPDDQVNALVNGALKSGGRDNVTVIVVGAASVDKAQMPAQIKPRRETTKQFGIALIENSSNVSHDRKIWLLLAAMGVAAVLWILL